MNKWLCYSVCFLLALLMNGSLLAATHANAQSLDRIIAIVNDAVITQSDLNEAIETTQKQLRSANTPIPPSEVLNKQVLTQLINRKLQLQLAEQVGIKVSEEDVNHAIKNIAQNNGISVEEVYAKVARDGLNKAAYRKEIQDEIAIAKIQQQEVGARIVISPQEVNDFMHSPTWQTYNTKEYHLEDILIGLSETPSSQEVVAARQRAEKIIDRIHHGTPFGEIAAAESSGNQALQGGDLGWRKLPEIPSAFADKLVHLKEKQILGPIQTANGFHVVYIAGIRTVNLKGDAASQRKQIQDLIFQRKYEEALQTWINKLHSEAFINMHPETVS